MTTSSVKLVRDFKIPDALHLPAQVELGKLGSSTLGITDTANSKSQIAIEYCYRFRKSNPTGSVFWIYCATVERFRQAYQDIARELSLPGWNDPTADIMKLVSRALSNENHSTWLMVLDNADDIEKFFAAPHSLPEGERSVPLVSYLPRTSNGFILVTTRDNRVGRRLTDNHPISILPFDLQGAHQLLQSKLPESKAENKNLIDEDAEVLLRELECLPLAITQAAAFISENSISVAEYVRMLQHDDSELATLLDRGIPDLRRDSEASNSVLQTWKLSFDQIQKQQPRAAEMLSLMALFDRESIPRFLLQRDEEKESEFVIASGILQAFSLISVAGEEGNFSLHRLVQLFTTAWLEIRDESKSFQEQALQILSSKYPRGEYENWKTCKLLAPHAQVILSYQPSMSKSSSLHRATLLYDLALFERKQGRYKSALLVCKESYERRRDLLGESAETLYSLGLLASILDDQGKYDEAETMHRQTLTSMETLLGKEHPETLISMNELALVLAAQGKYDEAEIMHRQTLLLNEELLGDEHPVTLASMNNLAKLLIRKDRYDEAEKMHRRELTLCEKVRDEEHPDTITGMHHLALVWHKQGKYDQAEMMNRRALRLYEKSLGKEHPYTLTSMNNLSIVLRDQGKYEEAEELMRNTITLCEKVLGVEHSDTLISVWELGRILHALGRREEGYNLSHNAHLKLLQILGERHPVNLIHMKWFDDVRDKMDCIS